MNRINYAQTVDNEMEMPTYCQHCCEIFDLNDGRCSEKWYPNVIICENYWKEDEQEEEHPTNKEKFDGNYLPDPD